MVRTQTTLGQAPEINAETGMDQRTPDLPRFVQIMGRYRTLVGVMAVLGLLAGTVFAAVDPPVFTSEALVVVEPTCPAGAICGGPDFTPEYIPGTPSKVVPSGVQVKPATGNILSVTASAGTAAQAKANADAAADSYLGEQVSAQLLQPAITATGTAPQKRLLGDALLGMVLGALLGVIGALAGSRTTIDPLPAAQALGVGEGDGGAAQEAGSGPTGVWLEQPAREHAKRTADRDGPLGRPEAEPV